MGAVKCSFCLKGCRRPPQTKKITKNTEFFMSQHFGNNKTNNQSGSDILEQINPEQRQPSV